ncbi:hypothetical protein GGR97_001799 [Wenyingzhuangia aestuarii]|nr:hypothetical protein [Wenyingzhuangia aestuarii]
MKMLKSLSIIFLILMSNPVTSQQSIGINVTGLERFWDETPVNYKTIIGDIDELHNQGIRNIRLPVSFEYQFKQKSKRRFLKELVKIVKHVKKKNMTLIVCYFDNRMDKYSNYTNINTLKDDWKYIARKLKRYSDCISYELVNEPNLYPIQWDSVVHEIVPEIRKKDKKTTILIGATNYNSIYELSRKTPFPYENLIYTFHFYEPFLFTHQGAEWVGNQTATVNIPYPYDSIKMPKINVKSINTPGEVNYKDYYLMANKTALQHKIEIIHQWAKKYNVEVWCTEFGAINSISKADRCRYFKDLIAVFKEKNIPYYIWEYKGNFGVYNTNKTLECF